MTKKCKTDESHGITTIPSAVRPFLFPDSGFRSRVPLVNLSKIFGIPTNQKKEGRLLLYGTSTSVRVQHSARVLLAGDGPVVLQR